MDGMPQLAATMLLRPWWLLALPGLVLLSILALRRVRGLGAWEKAFDPALLAAMERFGHVVPGAARRIFLPVAVAAIAILALSGPARRIADPDTFRNLDGIVLAIDLSRSIAEGGSLDDAQAAAQMVLQRSGGRPVAMIVYAGEAYVASAFTSDAQALSPVLAVLDGEIVPNAGSRSDRALDLAASLFSEAGILSGDVVLVTDGDHLTPQAFDAAARLAAANIRVNAFLVEPTERHGDMPPPDRDGLARLVRLGGGSLGRAADPEPLADTIGDEAASTLAKGETAALFFRDYGRYLLIFALFPALALFRRAT